jgi:Na+/proline symporter
MGAAVIAIVVVIRALPQGWEDFTAIGIAHEKFKIIHISFQSGEVDYWLNFSNPNSLIAGMLFGCFSTLAAFGTDQDMVQRMLTCEKVKEGQRALILTALMNFPVTLIFLMVGASMFCYYQMFPDPIVTGFIANNQKDSIFPHFIKTALDPGLRGFIISGMLAAGMSSVDSASNALASSAYIDTYKRYINPHAGDRQAVVVSRWFTGLFIFILALLAYLFGQTESILWMGFKIVGYTYGAMLGIFLLAVLTETRGHDRANAIIMMSSVVVVLFLTAENIGALQQVREWLLHPLGIKLIAWPWAIVIGTMWTFGLGLLFSSGSNHRAVH